MPSLKRTRRLTATLAIALTALPGLAQIIELSSVLHTKTVLSATDLSEIDAFIAAHSELIAGGEQGVITRSRNALTKPIQSANVTLAFRHAYGNAVRPIAESLVASSDPVPRMAGLRIAGKLGTDDACRMVLEALNDPDEGVRFFAITSLGDALGTMTSAAPSLSNAAAADTIRALGAIITDSDQPAFADTAVRSLTKATQITNTDLSATRSLAIETLCEAVGDRLRSTQAANPNSHDEMGSAIRACLVVRNAIIGGQFEVSRSTATAAIRLGADSVGYVFTRQRAGEISGDESDKVEISLCRNAEQLIYQGRQQADEFAAPNTNLFEQIKTGNERQFRIRTTELIGSESGIVANYGFTPDRFIRPTSED